MLDLEPSRGVGPWGFDSPPGTKDCAFVSKDLPNAWFESQKWITTGKEFCRRSVVDLGPSMPRVSIPHIFGLAVEIASPHVLVSVHAKHPLVGCIANRRAECAECNAVRTKHAIVRIVLVVDRTPQHAGSHSRRRAKPRATGKWTNDGSHTPALQQVELIVSTEAAGKAMIHG